MKIAGFVYKLTMNLINFITENKRGRQTMLYSKHVLIFSTVKFAEKERMRHWSHAVVVILRFCKKTISKWTSACNFVQVKIIDI